jgi:hypothetical protein
MPSIVPSRRAGGKVECDEAIVAWSESRFLERETWRAGQDYGR